VVRQRGEHVASVRPGIEIEATREPVGVVAIVTPWNFPIAITAWKIAPVLAYGNCVLFKPADLVPSSAWALAEITSRAGFPADVFNLVMGPGSRAGQAFVNHPAVNAITFIGSVGTSRRVLEGTARRMAKAQLEMGGKNPPVVLDDADPAQAVECAVQGCYYSTGQRCTASSRLIVQKGILPHFVDAMKARLEALVVDDARKPGTQIGPVVDQSQLDVDLEYLVVWRAEGARLLNPGKFGLKFELAGDPRAQIVARLPIIDAKERALAVPHAVVERVPTFCSGRPHNTATHVPEGSPAGRHSRAHPRLRAGEAATPARRADSPGTHLLAQFRGESAKVNASIQTPCLSARHPANGVSFSKRSSGDTGAESAPAENEAPG